MSPSARRSGALIECAVELLLLFGFLLGIGSASTIAYYATAPPPRRSGRLNGPVHRCVRCGGFATRRDLSGLSRILLWALVGLIALGIVLVFVQIPGRALVCSVICLMIFAGLGSVASSGCAAKTSTPLACWPHRSSSTS